MNDDIDKITLLKKSMPQEGERIAAIPMRLIKAEDLTDGEFRTLCYLLGEAQDLVAVNMTGKN